MTTRRGFVAGLLAAGALPAPSWADLGGPAWLSAARVGGEDYRLFGLSASGAALFDIPLPTRGHAAAAHPRRPEAVAFARRPGTYALVLDCLTGRPVALLDAAPGRHFYGHGTFSADGDRLYTTENDYEAARGVIGIWDADAGYARIGEIASGGTGPHDLTRLPGKDILVVANGGIETHPESGRAKLNLPTMRPNLTYLDPERGLLDVLELPDELRLNSIRHLAVRSDGLVAFAMQWQGDAAEAPLLLGLHQLGKATRFCGAEGPEHRSMQGYAGSVAFAGDGRTVAITSPRGGRAQLFDSDTGRLSSEVFAPDVCGVAEAPSGLILTTGSGHVLARQTDRTEQLASHSVSWDNHLVDL